MAPADLAQVEMTGVTPAWMLDASRQQKKAVVTLRLTEEFLRYAIICETNPFDAQTAFEKFARAKYGAAFIAVTKLERLVNNRWFDYVGKIVYDANLPQNLEVTYVQR